MKTNFNKSFNDDHNSTITTPATTNTNATTSPNIDSHFHSHSDDLNRIAVALLLFLEVYKTYYPKCLLYRLQHSNDSACHECRSKQTIELEKQTMEKLIEMMDAVISEEKNNPHHVNLLCTEIRKTDDQVVERYKDILKREFERNIKPTEEEKTWLKVMWRFFLVYVQFYSKILAGTLDWGKFYIFLAHRGDRDRQSYTLPLFEYLQELAPGKVTFIDKNMKSGTVVRDTILCAALSCKVYWCVATEAFFTEKMWPLREFIIGCCRFMLEPNLRDSKYCLLIDCVETSKQNEEPSGHWKGKILSTTSLKMYNKNGIQVDFPSMEGAKADESFRCRHQRLCSRQLSNGDILVCPKQTIIKELLKVLWRFFFLGVCLMILAEDWSAMR